MSNSLLWPAMVEFKTSQLRKWTFNTKNSVNSDLNVVYIQFIVLPYYLTIDPAGNSRSAPPTRGPPPSYGGSSRYDDYSSSRDGYGGSRDSYSSSQSDLYSSGHDLVGSKKEGFPLLWKGGTLLHVIPTAVQAEERQEEVAVEGADLIEGEAEADIRNK